MLVVENVGNRICPTGYDLGEDFKVVLLSVAEGEDKPFEYPGIFARAGRRRSRFRGGPVGRPAVPD